MTNDDRPLFLVIDQGGHASRALAYDTHGDKIAESYVDIATQRTPPDIVEHDPDELVDSIERACRETTDKLGGDARRLVSAGLATQRSSVVAWDLTDGAALSPVLSWQDRRAAGSLAYAYAAGALVRTLTGLVVSPHYGASKIRWCLDNLDEVRAARANGTLRVGPLASFLLFRITQARTALVDPANASRTLLWDRHTRDWSRELCELFRVPADLLPRSVASRYAFGPLAACHGLPLTVVTGDQSAALYAFGQPRRDTAYINIGTGAFIQRPVGATAVDVPGLLSSVAWTDERVTEYVVEGTVNGAGSALTRVAAELGVDSHKDLAAGLGALASATTVPLFLNGVSGLGAPFWIADFPVRFVGEATPQVKLVAVLESIAFLIQVNLDQTDGMLSPAQHIVVTGGLAQVDALCQMIADLSGAVVVRPVVREATALGLAWLTAGRPQEFVSATDERRFLPGPSRALLVRFERWSAAMRHAGAAAAEA